MPIALSSRPNVEPAIKRKINKAQPGTVRLWTIQPLAVWTNLIKTGTLLVDPTHEDFADGSDKQMLEAYDWLREQMYVRIPNYDGGYPWWAYTHFLDLRFYRFQQRPPNNINVRIELAIPREKVLLSAYGDWHCVLNRTFCPYDDSEEGYEIEFERWVDEAKSVGVNVFNACPLPEPWECNLRTSWSNIFDVEPRSVGRTVQGTFEKLELAEVVSVRMFTSR